MQANSTSLIKVGNSLLEGRLIIIERADHLRAGKPAIKQFLVRWRDCQHKRKVAVTEVANYTECARCRQSRAKKAPLYVSDDERAAALAQYRKYLIRCAKLGVPSTQARDEFIREAIEVMRLEAAHTVFSPRDESIYQRRDYAPQLYQGNVDIADGE